MHATRIRADRSLVNRHQERRVAKGDCLCGVQDEKTTLQAERRNLNSKWRKALRELIIARAKTGECDGITAVRILLFFFLRMVGQL